MSYRETAQALGLARMGGVQASCRLSMSDWAEARRDSMTPQTIAANHALHVERTAADLRVALGWHEQNNAASTGVAVPCWAITDAARALLAAIGEAE